MLCLLLATPAVFSSASAEFVLCLTMDPSREDDMDEDDPFFETMPIPNELEPERQSSPDVDDASQSQNCFQQQLVESENDVQFVESTTYCSSPILFEEYYDDDDTLLQNLSGPENSDNDGSNPCNSPDMFDGSTRSQCVSEQQSVGNTSYCVSPDIFEGWPEDGSARPQHVFEREYSDDNVEIVESQDMFPDYPLDGATRSQNLFEQQSVGNTSYCVSPLLFEEYLDDDVFKSKPLINLPPAAGMNEIDESIHLISALKEHGVSELNISTLCENGIDTVESYLFASSNNRYQLPGLDEDSKCEIEAAAKAIVPEFGFTQATQIHRGCESPDLFSGEFPDDQLPPSTSAPARKIHLISELEMPSEILNTLVTNGYVSVESLLRETFREVMESTKLPKDIVDQLQNAAREIVPDFGYTQTMQLYRRKTETVFITTGCAGIDTLLGGGVRSGSITQIFGESGSGKTQISHMLAVTVQLPANKGGADAKCIYLDSRNSFRTTRLIAIANALNLNPTSVLDNIAYAQVKTTGQQSVLLHQASSLLCSGSYALLIVDDVISVFKEEYGNASEIAARQIELTKFLKSLANIAKKYGISVVFLNQIVSQLNPNKPQFGLNLPAGGRCVAIASDTRLSLTKGKGGCRVAAIYDPDHQNAETATFFITANGLADVQ